MRVAVCDLTSTDDFSRNLDCILDLAEKAAEQEAELICFPENSLYFRIRERDKFAGFTLADPIFDPLSNFAKANGVALHLGGLPLSEGNSIFNATVVIGVDGRLDVTYRKTHLFDINLKGKESANESSYFTAGESWEIWKFRDWKIGQTICFDVRFPEIYRYLVDEGAEAFTVPAAFIMSTGEAHWELLVRTRAIETQAFVFAATQQGIHKGVNGGEKKCWGQSMIVDPWGTVISKASGQGIHIADVNRRQVKDLRKQVPLAQHRKSCKVKR